MAEITIQVLEGLERGRVFDSLETPVTIGREDDNSIQLNDERVSRFHSKIQEDGDRIILTDLDSTNGTRVNGRPIQLRVLRPGDQVAIGRCLLLYGSRAEIAEFLGTADPLRMLDTTPELGTASGATLNLPLPADDDLELIEFFPGGPPELPGQLTPLQQAQLSDLVSFIHDRIGSILHAAVSVTPADALNEMAQPELEKIPGESVEPQGESIGEEMVVAVETWQRLLALEMELAVYLRSIAEPNQLPDLDN
jgi:predicted component of type VI protein secretion system